MLRGPDLLLELVDERDGIDRTAAGGVQDRLVVVTFGVHNDAYAALSEAKYLGGEADALGIPGAEAAIDPDPIR